MIQVILECARPFGSRLLFFLGLGLLASTALFAQSAPSKAAESSATEQDVVITPSEEILRALKRPPGLPTRNLRPPDENAPTYMCDSKQEAAARAKTGLRGEGVTRNLFVETAPSIDLDVRFDFGHATVSAQGRKQLDALAAALNERQFANLRFAVAGHTDAKGAKADNERLSCDRAHAVKRYLVTKHKVEADRLITFGFGFTKLKLPDEPSSHENRRVEIRKSDG